MTKVYPMNSNENTAPGNPAAERSVERAEERGDAVTAHHLVALEKLRDMGVVVASALKERVIYAAVEGKTDDKAAKSFALVTKTVEQVILLHQEIAGLREKRRASLLAERKAQAKKVVRGLIDRQDAAQGVAAPPRTEAERQVRRVRLDELFNGLGDAIFEGLSVAEIVAHACQLFGVTPDPTPPWPEWAEIRGESLPEPAAEPPAGAVGTKPRIPAGLSGASAIGLNGRMPPLGAPKGRAPP
jgi:hypothetical protein